MAEYRNDLTREELLRWEQVRQQFLADLDRAIKRGLTAERFREIVREVALESVMESAARAAGRKCG